MIRKPIDDPVVVTGIGLVTPLGGSREATWRSVLDGTSAGRFLQPTDFPDVGMADPATCSGWLGCPAVGPKRLSVDGVVDLALRVSREAVADAGLSLIDRDRVRTGCVFGTSKGSMHAATALYRDRISRQSTSTIQAALLGPGVASVAIAADLGLAGPLLSPVAACATGLAAILRGAELVARGDCDVVIAGSADDSLHPLVLASFQRLGVLARSDKPQTACRPFDRLRNGFVIGSGAGCLVLERRSHAYSRGTRWYAELGRGRLLSDPTGMTSLDDSGNSLAQLIRTCLPEPPRARIAIPDVVNLHGTATKLNDIAECRALENVFGAALEHANCGSLKGGLGHLLGAAGSVEVGLSCLMLRDQMVPPAVNLNEFDPECRLPWVTRRPLRRPIRSILKLSLGFGGHQAALWLERGLD